MGSRLWYLGGMAADVTLSQTVDLTGLPEPVVRDIRQLVETLRGKLAGPSAGPRKPLAGRLAHLNHRTPTLDEFEESRREAWANFPREFPDPTP